MITPSYSLAVFDLDGTLLDTSRGITAAICHTLRELGLPPLSKACLNRFIGPPIEQGFSEFCGLEGEQLLRAATVFRRRYSEQFLLQADPYGGIFEALDHLRQAGVKIAVATYKRETYARPLLAHFGFDRYTDTIYGSDPEGKLRKHDILTRCLSACHITDATYAVMVGDTLQDARAAATAGTDFIGACYGFGLHTEKERNVCRARAFVHTPSELVSVILPSQPITRG
ncbi:MAG: HAD hydrolase-like protein [Clostridia bacterium]|nr:HAD hydrolase-like protein [Clostridia bacterium]